MNILKKIFIIFIFVFFVSPGTKSYKSEDIITLHVDSPATRTSVFLVPEGKDLIIKKIYINDDNENVYIRNNGGGDVYHSLGKFIDPLINIVIKDNFEILATPGTDVHILIEGYLVSEDQEMQYFIEGNSSAWSQHIFNKKDIDFIYFREFILMFFISIIKFFSVILGRNIYIF